MQMQTRPSDALIMHGGRPTRRGRSASALFQISQPQEAVRAARVRRGTREPHARAEATERGSISSIIELLLLLALGRDGCAHARWHGPLLVSPTSSIGSYVTIRCGAPPSSLAVASSIIQSPVA
jgi:hypothetical protein